VIYRLKLALATSHCNVVIGKSMDSRAFPAAARTFDRLTKWGWLVLKEKTLAQTKSVLRLL
jgi:hypothetical protein